MANVSFKHGLQSNLPTSGVEGTFYLTTDTNRLYIGKAGGAIELLNQGVKVYDTWATISNLPKTNSELSVEGQIYYAKEDNILCAYSKGNWVQINPDTDTDNNTKIVGMSIAKNTQQSNTDKLVYDVQLTERTDVKGSTGANVKGASTTLTINKEDLNALVTEVSVGVSSSNSTNDAILSLNGTGSNSNVKTQITGEGTVTIKSSSNTSGLSTITIGSNPYSLITINDSNQGVIKLQQSGGDVGTVNVMTSGSLSAISDDKGNITLAHKDSGVTKGSYKGNAAVSTTDTATTIITIPEFTVNAEGHVTNAKTNNYNIKDTRYKLEENGLTYSASNGELSIILKTSDGEEAGTATLSNAFYTNFKVHDVNSNGSITSSEQQIYNQKTADFDLYTKEAVDAQIANAIKTADAMTFKGAMTAAPTTGTSNRGDTYKAASDFTFGTGASAVNVTANDLIIFNANDGSASNVATNWVIIPADTANTTYTFSGSNSIQLTGSDSETTGTIAVGDGLDITNEGSAFTITHQNTISEGNTNSAAGKQTINADARTFVIPTIKYNNTGHITGVSNATVTLPEDKNTTYTLERTANATGFTLKASDSSDAGKFQIINGTSISVSNEDDDGIKISHAPKTVSAKTANTNVAFGGSFTADHVTNDEEGHLNSITTTTYTLPNLPVFVGDGFAAVSENKLTFGYDVKADEQSITKALSVGLTSNSLAITGTTTDCSIDIVWGSF